MKKEKLNEQEETKDQNPTEELKPLYFPDHKQPTTRREFMARGFLGATAFALAPSVLSLLSSQNAFAAADCPVPSISTMTPVIIIDLPGGGNIAGSNVIVGGQGGQMDLLPSYEQLGLPSSFHPSRSGMVSHELGLAFHSDSGMLRGIRGVTSPGTRNKCEGAIFCTSLSDDTANNQSNPIYWLNKAGATGQLLQLAGTTATPSGGRQSAPSNSVNPSLAPVKIANGTDAQNLVSTGKLTNFFAQDKSFKVDKVLNSIAKISNEKINSLSRRSLPEEIKKLVSCGFQQTSEQVKSFTPDVLNPALDPDVSAVFNNLSNTLQARTASITKLVLDGYIGVGTIQLGGYDYHDGTRSLGETRDVEAGQCIGRIFELAAKKGKDVVVIVLTDGGVSTNRTIDTSAGGRDKFIWTGDAGVRSSSLMMVYKHAGRPQLRKKDFRQIGYFNNSNSVMTTALLTSNSDINLSKALVANYLALHGKEGQLANVVIDEPFGLNLEKYLVFDKLG